MRKRVAAPVLRVFLAFIVLSNPAYAQVKSSITRLVSVPCNEKFFFNLYGNGPHEYEAFEMAITNDDTSVIIVGSARKFLANDFTDGLITKINKNGIIQWARTIEGTGSQYVYGLEKLSDGNFVGFGTQAGSVNVSFFLVKFDNNGNIIWKKDYSIPIAGELFGNAAIKEDTDGSLIITGQFAENGLSFSDRVLLLKLDGTGNLLISKFFKPPGIISSMYISDLILKDGYSYTVGGYYFNTGMKGFVLKTDNSNGNFVWSKFYGFNNGDAEFHQILPYTNNRFCLVGPDDVNPKDTSLMFIIDTAGVCTSSKYLQFNTGWPREYGSAAMTSDYELTWALPYYRVFPDSTSFTLTRVHPENGIIYSRDFRQLSSRYLRIFKTIISPDSSIYFTSLIEHTGMTYPMYLARFSKDGTLGCLPEPIPANFGSGSVQTSNLSMSTHFRTYPAISPNNPYNSYPLAPIDSLCTIINYCDTLKIHGDDTLCDLQQGLIFSVYKNPQCISSARWTINNNVIQSLTHIDDTTIQIQFNQSWQGYLFAEILTSCGVLKDSVFITVLHSPGQVALGPDSSICANNVLLLNAQTGYVSYLWQDGSTDSTYSVNMPGSYWVQVKDACNNIFRDTIIISAAPPIPFDLGPDLSKCNSDSVTVSAPPGFINYSWSPNYNISTTTNQNVLVFPAVDTMYKVVAEKTPGCFAYDSIYINVNNSSSIYLGADTSFCSGNSIVLNAGNLFTNYLWNTGQSSASIMINSAGAFSVIATDANSCISKDTLRVINVFNNPIVNLPKDSLLCTGSSKNLNAGAGMASYLWSTAAATNSISVNNIGTYWVNVTDNNGCKGTDTTRITRLLALPAAFLPADTVLCSYSSLKISSSQSYLSYLWSTGSSQPAITISQPGTYSLRVTDNFNCIGRDTIVVNPKQCLEGIFVPNAFTPNNDGKNDIFRPLLLGVVLQFNFRIYNRWGQLVYETKELGKGWDGKVSGRDASSAVFVWTCEYQFEGQLKKLAKGTFVLIR